MVISPVGRCSWPCSNVEATEIRAGVLIWSDDVGFRAYRFRGRFCACGRSGFAELMLEHQPQETLSAHSPCRALTARRSRRVLLPRHWPLGTVRCRNDSSTFWCRDHCYRRSARSSPPACAVLLGLLTPLLGVADGVAVPPPVFAPVELAPWSLRRRQCFSRGRSGCRELMLEHQPQETLSAHSPCRALTARRSAECFCPLAAWDSALPEPTAPPFGVFWPLCAVSRLLSGLPPLLGVADGVAVPPPVFAPVELAPWSLRRRQCWPHADVAPPTDEAAPPAKLELIAPAAAADATGTRCTGSTTPRAGAGRGGPGGGDGCDCRCTGSTSRRHTTDG